MSVVQVTEQIETSIKIFQSAVSRRSRSKRDAVYDQSRTGTVEICNVQYTRSLHQPKKQTYAGDRRHRARTNERKVESIARKMVQLLGILNAIGSVIEYRLSVHASMSKRENQKRQTAYLGRLNLGAFHLIVVIISPTTSTGVDVFPPVLVVVVAGEGGVREGGGSRPARDEEGVEGPLRAARARRRPQRQRRRTSTRRGRPGPACDRRTRCGRRAGARAG